ncbi:hypothetical protein RCOM_0991210 [Ricinus communis]|uniref:Beta-carotene isomerase D27-like C-terminal domain-containing protein n=1 Tax=Ricinus communis TaxID=3988 RepID=B9S4R1_RICCO|nr:hypothetical protein RCOM_0991210 [Ricinus communis]
MEAIIFPQNRGPIPSQPLPRQTNRLNKSRIFAVLTKPTENISGVKEKKSSDNLPGLTSKISIYRDSWFDQLAINHLSQSVQAATGIGCISISTNLPIKTLLPQSRFTREYFAAFTTLFFVWLIGPCQVRESEFNGRKEKNVVHIKKCRFLEETNCVGMCTNLCKVPTQTFIKQSLGMPVNMVPSKYPRSTLLKQDPPIPTEDPAFRQPCYKLCNALPHPFSPSHTHMHMHAQNRNPHSPPNLVD